MSACARGWSRGWRDAIVEQEGAIATEIAVRDVHELTENRFHTANTKAAALGSALLRGIFSHSDAARHHIVLACLRGIRCGGSCAVLAFLTCVGWPRSATAAHSMRWIDLLRCCVAVHPAALLTAKSRVMVWARNSEDELEYQGSRVAYRSAWTLFRPSQLLQLLRL